jgi:predicted ester cyclase
MSKDVAVVGANLDPIRERLAWRADADEYEAIRRLWINHSKAEDAHDLDGLVATLTEDCVYEIFQSGHRWENHDGARRFYTELLTAFPDIHFDLQDIVIGPQGVFEVAEVNGTFAAPWLGEPPDGKRRYWRSVIHFPWDRERKKFRGENVYTTESTPGSA